jgi:hypothetical protein
MKMKKIKLAALATIAMLAIPGTAHADGIAIGQQTGFGGLFGIGTSYGVLGGSLGDTEAATPTVATDFTLTGTVNRDCSFYAGNNAAARNINFGTIGVRTGSGENVGDAFEMRAPAGVVITSGTAGCNTKNQVTISKANGVDGMTNLAAAAGGYDTNQFTDNLPYSVNAIWTGVGVGVVGAGTTRTLTVSTGEASDNLQGGAWRSGFGMTVAIPQPNLGLVAGTYSDVLTVTLAAI